MGKVPYNFDPEYSVEEILQLSTETIAQTPPFLYDSYHFPEHSQPIYNIFLVFYQKHRCERYFGSSILLIFDYIRICVFSECYLL